MITHHRETTDGHRKDLRKLLKPVLKPLLAVVISLTEQERATHAARDAVVPAGQGHIHQLSARDRHKRTPDGAYALLYVSTVVSSRPICDHVFKNHRVRRSGRHSQNGHAEKRGWPALHVLATSGAECRSLQREHPLRSLTRRAGSRAGRIGTASIASHRSLLYDDAVPVVPQPIEQDPVHSAVPLGEGRPFC
jgi:hypothetical protein